MARLGLTWRPEAREQLDGLVGYIAERDEAAAARLLRDIEEAAERASAFPSAHRTGRVPGTRELVVRTNYLLVYRVTATAVDVVAVLHARQRYP